MTKIKFLDICNSLYDIYGDHYTMKINLKNGETIWIENDQIQTWDSEDYLTAITGEEVFFILYSEIAMIRA